MNAKTLSLASLAYFLGLIILVGSGGLFFLELNSNSFSGGSQKLATVSQFKGLVKIRVAGESLWRPVEDAQQLYAGDQLMTGRFSFADLILADGREFQIKENSVVLISPNDLVNGKIQLPEVRPSEMFVVPSIAENRLPAAAKLKNEVNLSYPLASQGLEIGQKSEALFFVWDTELSPPYQLEVSSDPGFTESVFKKQADKSFISLVFERPEKLLSQHYYWRVTHLNSRTVSGTRSFDLNWLEAPRLNETKMEPQDRKEIELSWTSGGYRDFLVNVTVDGVGKSYELKDSKLKLPINSVMSSSRPVSILVEVRGITEQKTLSEAAHRIITLEPKLKPMLKRLDGNDSLMIKLGADGSIDCEKPARFELIPKPGDGKFEIIEQSENGIISVKSVNDQFIDLCPKHLGQTGFIYKLRFKGQGFTFESDPVILLAKMGVPDIAFVPTVDRLKLMIDSPASAKVEAEIKSGAKIDRALVSRNILRLNSDDPTIGLRFRYLSGTDEEISDWSEWKSLKSVAERVCLSTGSAGKEIIRNWGLKSTPYVYMSAQGAKPWTWLNWQSQPDARGYEIEIAADSKFMKREKKTVSEAKYFLELPKQKQSYYWRVRAVDAQKAPIGEWSPVVSFQVLEIERKTSSTDSK